MNLSILLPSPLRIVLGLATVSIPCALGVTSFVPVPSFDSDPRGGAAEWDIFTAASGSQGASPITSGLNVSTSSEMTIDVLAAIASPGGLIAGGDTYYSHSGAYAFSIDVAFAQGVDFARVSYALVGAQGAPEPFPVAPEIVDATSLGSGSYNDANNNTIFYTDFELASSQTEITATFGDTPAPFMSFRSINGVRVEGLSANPIPEPSSALLAMLGIAAVGLNRRRPQVSPLR